MPNTEPMHWYGRQANRKAPLKCNSRGESQDVGYPITVQVSASSLGYTVIDTCASALCSERISECAYRPGCSSSLLAQLSDHLVRNSIWTLASVRTHVEQNIRSS